MSCGVGRKCSLDLALLWLWHRLGAVAPIRPLAWELHKNSLLDMVPLHSPGSHPLATSFSFTFVGFLPPLGHYMLEFKRAALLPGPLAFLLYPYGGHHFIHHLSSNDSKNQSLALSLSITSSCPVSYLVLSKLIWFSHQTRCAKSGTHPLPHPPRWF